MPGRNNTPFDRTAGLAAQLCAPLGTNRGLDGLAIAVFLGLVVAVFVLSVALPQYNYDLVAYLGAALKSAGEPDFHIQAWQLARDAMPADVYQDISAANEYRQAQSGDADAFLSVLPLYSVKAGYIGMLNLLGPTFGYIKTALWSGHLAGLSLCLICLWWMIRREFAQGAIVIAPLLLILNYTDLTSHPSPDIIASALIMLALYLLISGHQWSPLLLLGAAFLFRPDTLIFVFALLLAQLLFGQKPWRAALLFMAMMAASMVIRDVTGHPGWWVHYYFSTVTIQNTLVGFDPAISLFSWGKGMARGVFMSLTEFNWPSLLALIGFALAWCIKTGQAFTRTQKMLLTACILTIGGKFMAFPLPDDRIYMVFILGAAMILLEVAKPKFGWREPQSPISA